MLRQQCKQSLGQALHGLRRRNGGLVWGRKMPSTAATVNDSRAAPVFAQQLHASPPPVATDAAPNLPTGARLSKPLLLVSDLDDTLLPCNLPNHPTLEAGTAAFKSIWQRSRSLGAACKLAINTGRTLPLFEQVWSRKGALLLPIPDVCIAGVGTRIYHNTPTGWLEDAAWTSHMNKDWDSDKAKQIMDGLIETFGNSSVAYRPADEMHEHKITIHYQADLRDKLVPLLERQLQEARIKATVIEGGAIGSWRFIDLLPQHAGKGEAMQYVQRQFGYDEASTVACGDAMNDLLMLQQACFSIVVGNGVPEIKAWAESVNKQHERMQLHIADGQQTEQQQQQQVRSAQVYISKAPVAAGVLEGLIALGFLQLQPGSELRN